MPLRRYFVIQPDGADGEEFEVDLPVDAPDFAVHPVTKAPCRRVLESPTLTTKYGEGVSILAHHWDIYFWVLCFHTLTIVSIHPPAQVPLQGGCVSGWGQGILDP